MTQIPEPFPKRSVGLFGGSFNPVHNGHVAIVRAAQNSFPFEHFIVVPTGTPPHKMPFMSSASDRLEMTLAAFAHIPGIEVSRFEIERPGPSYTIDTLTHFRARFPGYAMVFVLGADAFSDVPQWHRFAEVLESTSFLVMARVGVDSETRVLASLEERRLLRPCSVEAPFSTAYATRSGTKVVVLPYSPPAVSSTLVRERWAESNGDVGSVKDLVPAGVAQYLKIKKLYMNPRVNHEH